ncbi:hypothetical protein MFMK1_002828 [Metallumcola ferriviriculae]|uniref:Uncharacterized protein n=1 Tax=Metallumcola ferriviriculae TaxID=3039180 RepID=A0AAU0URI8_9FIRM|nr:hypothetical protein MFMK1_002828 [Desulfitibacteraceae bacterium MK1]
MPRCMDCGNDTTFSSSAIPNGAPWANGPYSGLVASFSEGQVKHVENMGAAYEVAQEAFQRPEGYFDTCHHCGSANLQWP